MTASHSQRLLLIMNTKNTLLFLDTYFVCAVEISVPHMLECDSHGKKIKSIYFVFHFNVTGRAASYCT